MTYAYLRVSTILQDNDKFRPQILEYANKNDLGQVIFVEEKISGRKSWTERELGKLINKIHEGDVIIVPELSRLARSIKQIKEIQEEIIKKQAGIHILKENIIINTETNPVGNMFISMLAIFAEFEADILRMRLKEAFHVKKLEGVKLGRKKGSGLKLKGHEDEIKRQRILGVSINRIAKNMNVSYKTMYDFMTARGLK